MSFKTHAVTEFLQGPGVCVDVRSPLEFSHARIPGAVNIPLFSDEERALVGTVYKKTGQKEAIHLGVKLVGPKMSTFLEQAAHCGSNEFRLYCWRGGMRSGFLSWFFQFTGIPTTCLKGGYKAFRRHVLEVLQRPYHFKILGGYTGSGKTEFLAKMEESGEQVIDLEALACHRGSAFGYVCAQPSNEQFENEIALRLASFDPARPIWVEDESRMIGSCMIPQTIFMMMQSADLHIIKATKDERIARIISQYAQDKEQLVRGVERIQKKLGSQKTKAIIDMICAGDLHQATSHLLEYYDRTYSFSQSKRTGRRICLPLSNL